MWGVDGPSGKDDLLGSLDDEYLSVVNVFNSVGFLRMGTDGDLHHVAQRPHHQVVSHVRWHQVGLGDAVSLSVFTYDLGKAKTELLFAVVVYGVDAELLTGLEDVVGEMGGVLEVLQVEGTSLHQKRFY